MTNYNRFYSVIYQKRAELNEKGSELLRVNIYWLTDGFKTVKGVGAGILISSLKAQFPVSLEKLTTIFQV